MKRYQMLAIVISTAISIVTGVTAIRTSEPLRDAIINETLTFEAYANYIGTIFTNGFISGVTLMLATALFIKWGK
jgi:hypothetical protein